mmetsp:Transcript_33961/g.97668  ORF Transcript_33961/g.97668 Transcript_33961/m.97668 type:complete len:300 (+) Transcript_33961:371-1270(+)
MQHCMRRGRCRRQRRQSRSCQRQRRQRRRRRSRWRQPWKAPLTPLPTGGTWTFLRPRRLHQRRYIPLGQRVRRRCAARLRSLRGTWRRPGRSSRTPAPPWARPRSSSALCAESCSAGRTPPSRRPSRPPAPWRRPGARLGACRRPCSSRRRRSSSCVLLRRQCRNWSSQRPWCRSQWVEAWTCSGEERAGTWTWRTRRRPLPPQVRRSSAARRAPLRSPEGLRRRWRRLAGSWKLCGRHSSRRKSSFHLRVLKMPSFKLHKKLQGRRPPSRRRSRRPAPPAPPMMAGTLTLTWRTKLSR